MKNRPISVKRLFLWICAGLLLSMTAITLILFSLTLEVTVLIAGAALIVCAFAWFFVLTQTFGKRLSLFTSELCKTLDNMIVSNLKMVTDTLLTRPVTEAERIDFIKGVRSQTDKLDFLFQALVKTSRLETGVIRLEKKPGRIYDTVAQAMSGIVYAAEKKQIGVSVDCPENLTVAHDSKWTAEAIFNLLDNAVKYTPAGGKITVTIEEWEMYAEIKVADTGKGISERNQAAIFRRFYREEEIHEQPGVGIGLYLAREIVTKQGGYIKVVSELGNGSAFSIMLPLR